MYINQFNQVNMEYPKNFGLVIEPIKPEDYVLGSSNEIAGQEILQPDGHGWKPFLPALEVQRNPQFDTFGCVSFSALNTRETLLKRIYNIDFNHSDRFTVVRSGTIPGIGNSMGKVAESIRKIDGVVEESKYPFSSTMTQDEYYQNVPDNLIDEGQDSLLTFKTQYEFVTPSAANLMFALQYAPLQATGFAWETPVNGLYQKTNKTPNHAFVLYDYEEGKKWLVYDQYDNDFKELAWDYWFGATLKYSIEKLEQYDFAFLNDLYQQGLRYIQRTQNLGQVYRLEPDKITFLDSNKGADRHIPLVDEVIRVLNQQKKLTAISETDFNRLTKGR